MTKYQELCAKQEKYAELSSWARGLLNTLLQCVQNGTVPSANEEKEIERYAKTYGVALEDAKEYYEYLKGVCDRVTVYYCHKTDKFGFVTGDEVLPDQSSAVALLRCDRVMYSGVSMTYKSTPELLEVLQEALLKVAYFKCDAGQLVRVGTLCD